MALIVNRQQPAKALEISIARLQSVPNDRSAIINHALALLLNGYTSEVETLLNRISPGELDPDQNADPQLAWFEYYVATKQYAPARIAYSRLEIRRLFPNQLLWIREAIAKSPPPAPDPRRAGSRAAPRITFY